MDFVQSDCYNSVLEITASGSAIISELLRLSNFIPDVFLFQVLQRPNPKDKKKMITVYVTADGREVSI